MDYAFRHLDNIRGRARASKARSLFGGPRTHLGALGFSVTCSIFQTLTKKGTGTQYASVKIWLLSSSEFQRNACEQLIKMSEETLVIHNLGKLVFCDTEWRRTYVYTHTHGCTHTDIYF